MSAHPAAKLSLLAAVMLGVGCSPDAPGDSKPAAAGPPRAAGAASAPRPTVGPRAAEAPATERDGCPPADGVAPAEVLAALATGAHKGLWQQLGPACERAPVGPGEGVVAGAPLENTAHGEVTLRLGASKRLRLHGAAGLAIDGADTIRLQRGRIGLRHGRRRPEQAGPAADTAVRTDHGTVTLAAGRALADVDARADGVHVSVGRGLVVLEGAGGRLQLTRGQVGVLEATTGAPRPSPPGDVAAVVAWADAATGGPAPSAGFGELLGVDPTRGTRHPLELTRHAVRVDVRGLLARVTVEETFRNPTPASLDVRFRFPLPSGAVVADFSARVDGAWRPAKVVPRARATAAFQRAADAGAALAMLERDDGRAFGLRLSALPAGARREVRLSYDVPVVATSEGAAVAVPLRLPGSAEGTMPAVEAAMTLHPAEGGRAPTLLRAPLMPLTRTDHGDGRLELVYTPDRAERPAADLVVHFQSADVQAGELVSVAHGGAASRVRHQRLLWRPALDPPMDAVGGDRESPSPLLLAMDASSSLRDAERRVALAVAAVLIEDTDDDEPLNVMTFDRVATPWSDAFEAARDPAVRDGALAMLRDARDRGPSDLGAALARAADLLDATGDVGQLVMLSDGRPTMGLRAQGALADLASARLRGRGHDVVLVGVGAHADHELLQAVARAAGGTYHTVTPGDDVTRAALRLAQARREPCVRDLRLDVDGAPLADGRPALATRRHGNLRHGQALAIDLRCSADQPLALTVRGTLAARGGSSEPFERRFTALRCPPGDRPPVARAWAATFVRDQQQGGTVPGDALAEFAAAEGLVGPLTSLVSGTRETLASVGLADAMALVALPEGRGPVYDAASRWPRVASKRPRRAKAREGSSGGLDMGGLGVGSSFAPAAPKPARNKARKKVAVPRARIVALGGPVAVDGAAGSLEAPDDTARAVEAALARVTDAPVDREGRAALVAARLAAGDFTGARRAVRDWKRVDPDGVGPLAWEARLAALFGRVGRAVARWLQVHEATVDAGGEGLSDDALAALAATTSSDDGAAGAAPEGQQALSLAVQIGQGRGAVAASLVGPEGRLVAAADPYEGEGGAIARRAGQGDGPAALGHLAVRKARYGRWQVVLAPVDAPREFLRGTVRIVAFAGEPGETVEVVPFEVRPTDGPRAVAAVTLWRK